MTQPSSQIVIRGLKSPSIIESQRFSKLDTQRAESAKAAFIKSGIPADRIQIEASPRSSLNPSTTLPITKAALRGATVELVPTLPIKREPQRFTDDTTTYKSTKGFRIPYYRRYTNLDYYGIVAEATVVDTLKYLAGLWMSPVAAKHLRHAFLGQGETLSPPVDWIKQGWGRHYDKMQRNIPMNVATRVFEEIQAGVESEKNRFYFKKSHENPVAQDPDPFDQIMAIGGADLIIKGQYDWSTSKNGRVNISLHNFVAVFEDDYRFRLDKVTGQPIDQVEYDAQQTGILKPFLVHTSWELPDTAYSFNRIQGVKSLTPALP